jgi:hypothetical protein
VVVNAAVVAPGYIFNKGHQPQAFILNLSYPHLHEWRAEGPRISRLDRFHDNEKICKKNQANGYPFPRFRSETANGAILPQNLIENSLQLTKPKMNFLNINKYFLAFIFLEYTQ